jgi:hypothetical protein
VGKPGGAVMNDLELIELRIRILTVLLGKKIEQYHQATLRRDNTNKRRKLRKQCHELFSAISRLDKLSKKLGGEPECR